MKIETTTIQQSANELLGQKAKTLYYLIITNAQKEKLVVNVGEKTHKSVQELLKNDK